MTRRGHPNRFEMCGGHAPPQNLKVVFIGLPSGRYGYKKHESRSVKDNKTWWALRKEYRLDLGFPLYNDSFDLSPWLAHGIWVFPTSDEKSIGTPDRPLKEMFRTLKRFPQRIAFVFIGGNYEHFAKYIDKTKHLVLELATRKQGDRQMLVGSRLFSRIADFHKMSKSMWKLPVKIRSTV